jgi:surfeit locus 1 family protein
MKAPAGYRWNSPTRFEWVIITLAVLTLLGLGSWQVQRLQWKEAMIADIARANEAAPVEGWPQDVAALGWRRLQLSGHFLHKDEFHLAARYYRGQLGYHILTPFQLEDSRVVLLNRGWVPPTSKDAATRAEGQVDGPLSVVVQVRTDNDRTAFTPDADSAKNIWFWRDIDAMRKASGLLLEPATADVLHMEPPGGYPIASDGDIQLRNDHLGYAITWFSLALAAAVMFALYHLKPQEATA